MRDVSCLASIAEKAAFCGWLVRPLSLGFSRTSVVLLGAESVREKVNLSQAQTEAPLKEHESNTKNICHLLDLAADSVKLCRCPQNRATSFA